MFYFCVDENSNSKGEIEAWQTLVHVCRRWRGLVFGSPRRLGLRLVCTSRTPAKKTLDVWPALPLLIQCNNGPPSGLDNVLKLSNRVCQIQFRHIFDEDLSAISAAMQKPFPELTVLKLRSYRRFSQYFPVPVLPDSFLGGSAPRLRFLLLDCIPFPGLLKLLLTTTQLVHLSLSDIPHSGCFSPDAMFIALSRLTSLELLRLEFQSPQSCPARTSRRPLPPTRFILPVLTFFEFKGVSEYLDDLVARVDAPLLNNLYTTLFNQIVFDTPQVIQFISRIPTLNALNKASISLEDGATSIHISSRTTSHRGLNVRIQCKELDWQISALEQVCTFCLPPLSALEDLYISEEPSWQPYWQDNIENPLWLELLHPFTAVKNLYLSEEVARRIVPALQELVGGRATEVLPALQNIFLAGLEPSGPIKEGIGRFVATRQGTTSHPVAVSRWNR